MKKLVLLSILLIVGCPCPTEPEPIEGCMLPEACNYDSKATMHIVEICTYPTQNSLQICGAPTNTGTSDICDCEGNCSLVVDCNGVCGGGDIEDECGVCDGDGVMQTCGCGNAGEYGLPDGFCDCESTWVIENDYVLIEDITDLISNKIEFDTSFVESRCFYEPDLDVLTKFNISDSMSTVLDINFNGVVEPLEIVSKNLILWGLWGKSQIWFHGRLLALMLPQTGLIGNIPEEISNLDSLSLLSLAHNQLSGIIPESICNLSNLDFNYETFHGTPFNINALCPPYPSCLSNDEVGTQDTSNCPSTANAVSIADGAFNPPTLTIAVGETVTWTLTNGTHTVVSDDGSWASGTLSIGGTFQHQFNSVGEFGYKCGIHAGMTGSITIIE